MDTDQILLNNFIQNHTDQALTQIEKLESQDIAVLIESLTVELGVLLLSEMDPSKASRTLEKIQFNFAIDLIEQLPVRIAKILLSRMESGHRTDVLSKVSPQKSKLLKRILNYQQDTVGAYVDTKVFTLLEDLKVEDGLKELRKTDLYVAPHIFVIKRDYKLVGVIELNKLILADQGKSLKSIVDLSPPKVLADRSINDFLENKEWVEPYASLGVTDEEGLFLGVLRREIVSKISIKRESSGQSAAQASNALGDLYLIGVSGLFRSALEISSQNKK